MSKIAKLHSKNLIILASTFPRWKNDTVPGFVLDFAQHILPHVRSTVVVVPHFLGAKRREKLSSGISVKRFRYAYPYKFENIAYGQFQKSKFYFLKVLLYSVSEGWTTLLMCLTNRQAVINAHWLIPQGFVAVWIGRLTGTKTVVSVHGADVFTLNGKFMRKIKRFVLKNAEAVVANSSVTQAECTKLWPGRQYPVIPMGVDTERFQLPSKRASAKDTKVYTILFVGRLVASKGVMYLCAVAQELKKLHSDIRLTIIGDGPERPRIEQFIEQHNLQGTISLVGWIQPEELPSFYRIADVFVGPSIESEVGRKEALGLVFAEASASGLPVVTTDAGGMKDIVKDKVTGLIVPQKDAEALQSAIEYLYTHRAEAKKMGAEGSKLVHGNFSWDSVTERYIALMSDLI